MGMLSVTPSELFQFCLICSEKVKSLPLALLLPMPAVRLMLGMYPARATLMFRSAASMFSLPDSISGRSPKAVRYTSSLAGRGERTSVAPSSGRSKTIS